jgi:hypothetical protein
MKGIYKMETAYEIMDPQGTNPEDGQFEDETTSEVDNHATVEEELNLVASEVEASVTREEDSEQEGLIADEEAAAMTADELVETINDVYENNLGNAKMRIGTLVLQHCFDGDAEKARSKNPKKETSYKDVCDHKKLKMDVKELGRCVRAAAQQVEFEKEGVDQSELSFHALLEIAKLPEEAERLKLCLRANEESWTVREIRKHVDSWKKTEAEKAMTGKEAFRLLKQLKGGLTNSKLREFLSNEESLERNLESEDRLTLSKIAAHMAKQMADWSPIWDNTRKTISKIELADEEAAA